jgi:hypothetical protein
VELSSYLHIAEVLEGMKLKKISSRTFASILFLLGRPMKQQRKDTSSSPMFHYLYKGDSRRGRKKSKVESLILHGEHTLSYNLEFGNNI